MDNNRILLFSGGLDSYIAWHWLGKPQTVYFDLGTPYSSYEIKVIKELIPTTIIDSSLNLASRQMLDSDTAFIPMRNLYLAMLACKYGEEIIICGLKDDNVGDKTPQAFARFTVSLSALNNRQIKVTSPFWGMTKADIVKWYLETYQGDKAKLLETISCYTPSLDTKAFRLNKRYCGKCRCCFRKWNALFVNGIELPFYNLRLMAEYLDKAQHNDYITERNVSIKKAVSEYAWDGSFIHLGKTYRVDIDGVLTVETEGHDYKNRTPHPGRIDKVNMLYDQGARIVLWTSRYSQDKAVTKNWLAENNVRWDELLLGKPQYDGIIDDKVIDLNSVLVKGD